MAESNVQDFYIGLSEHFVVDDMVEDRFIFALWQIIRVRLWLGPRITCRFWFYCWFWKTWYTPKICVRWHILLLIRIHFLINIQLWLYLFSARISMRRHTWCGPILFQDSIFILVNSDCTFILFLPHKISWVHNGIGIVFFSLRQTFTILYSLLLAS